MSKKTASTSMSELREAVLKTFFSRTQEEPESAREPASLLLSCLQVKSTAEFLYEQWVAAGEDPFTWARLSHRGPIDVLPPLKVTETEFCDWCRKGLELSRNNLESGKPLASYSSRRASSIELDAMADRLCQETGSLNDLRLFAPNLRYLDQIHGTSPGSRSEINWNADPPSVTIDFQSCAKRYIESFRGDEGETTRAYDDERLRWGIKAKYIVDITAGRLDDEPGWETASPRNIHTLWAGGRQSRSLSTPAAVRRDISQILTRMRANDPADMPSRIRTRTHSTTLQNLEDMAQTIGAFYSPKQPLDDLSFERVAGAEPEDMLSKIIQSRPWSHLDFCKSFTMCSIDPTIRQITFKLNRNLDIKLATLDMQRLAENLDCRADLDIRFSIEPLGQENRVYAMVDKANSDLADAREMERTRPPGGRACKRQRKVD